MNGSLVSNIIEIRLDYPILYRSEILWNKIEELYKGAKPPQCNSDFMNKIEVRYNIIPSTWQSVAFELILIFLFYSRIQKRKVFRLSYAVAYIHMYINHMPIVHFNDCQSHFKHCFYFQPILFESFWIPSFMWAIRLVSNIVCN